MLLLLKSQKSTFISRHTHNMSLYIYCSSWESEWSISVDVTLISPHLRNCTVLFILQYVCMYVYMYVCMYVIFANPIHDNISFISLPTDGLFFFPVKTISVFACKIHILISTYWPCFIVKSGGLLKPTVQLCDVALSRKKECSFGIIGI